MLQIEEGVNYLFDPTSFHAFHVSLPRLWTEKKDGKDNE